LRRKHDEVNHVPRLGRQGHTGANWADGQPGSGPSSVLLLSAEDGWGDTIRPRLEAAGADLERCLCVAARQVEGEHGPMLRPVVLPDDIAWIAALIDRSAAAMVVIDVLAAYLSDRVDSHKDQSVRRLLAVLAAAAAKTGAAVILIRHHNKVPGIPALYRGGGSIGIIGAARAAFAVVRDPDDGDHRLLTTVKSNLAPEAPTWGYSLVDVPHLTWLGSNGTMNPTSEAPLSFSRARRHPRWPKLSPGSPTGGPTIQERFPPLNSSKRRRYRDRHHHPSPGSQTARLENPQDGRRLATAITRIA
jgi:hypothetical protein